MKLFWSIQQRFFRDLINTFKVCHDLSVCVLSLGPQTLGTDTACVCFPFQIDGPDGIVALTEQALRDGMCVVIGLQTTGESGLNKVRMGLMHNYHQNSDRSSS